MTAASGYRGPEVCRMAGITYRQLDYWARTDLVRPSLAAAHGQGSLRLYSAADVRALRAIKTLLDAGVSLQKAREVHALMADTEGLAWLVVGATQPFLVADGELEETLAAEPGAYTVMPVGAEPDDG